MLITIIFSTIWFIVFFGLLENFYTDAMDGHKGYKKKAPDSFEAREWLDLDFDEAYQEYEQDENVYKPELQHQLQQHASSSNMHHHFQHNDTAAPSESAGAGINMKKKNDNMLNPVAQFEMDFQLIVKKYDLPKVVDKLPIIPATEWEQMQQPERTKKFKDYGYNQDGKKILDQRVTFWRCSLGESKCKGRMAIYQDEEGNHRLRLTALHSCKWEKYFQKVSGKVSLHNFYDNEYQVKIYCEYTAKLALTFWNVKMQKPQYERDYEFDRQHCMSGKLYFEVTAMNSSKIYFQVNFDDLKENNTIQLDITKSA